MLRIIILIPLLVPVAPVAATGMSSGMGDESAERAECIKEAGNNYSPVDVQDVINNIDRAINKAADSERQHCKDSCYSESERFYLSSSLHVTSNTPVLLGLASTRSQHQGVISFFPAADHFPLNYNYQPPYRPPILLNTRPVKG